MYTGEHGKHIEGEGAASKICEIDGKTGILWGGELIEVIINWAIEEGSLICNKDYVILITG